MLSLCAFRARLSGFLGCALVATLCAFMVAPSVTAQQPPQAPTTPSASAPEQASKLTGDQLESLVAPIALYPDPLLAQVLVASTYPLDVVQAQQWLAKNSSLKGDALVKAAEQQSWDPSVQALVSIPEALKVLNENIKWTVDLGDAFLAQQSEVMDAVQRLRAKAKDSGKLASNEQQTVEAKVVEQKTVVVIEPASTEVVYVPSYSPTVIWGPLYYPYPPLYYPPYYGGAWIGFGVGIAVGIGIAGGWGWGCGWGGNNTININNNNNYVNHRNNQNGTNRTGNSNWQHNAKQRGGAPYKDRATASKYGGGTRSDRQAQTRQAQNRAGAGASNRASGGFDRGGASGNRGGAGSFDRGGSSGSRGGGGNFGSSSRAGSSAFGGSSSGSRARSSSSRGSSSMGGMSRGGGGMSRGGGGGRRR